MTYRSWFDQGVVAFRERRFEDALAMFDKVSLPRNLPGVTGHHYPVASQVIELGGTLPILYDSRSAVLEKLGRYGDALKDAKKAIDISPQSPQARTAMDSQKPR
jgi:tetratricopeptide (TPR) repeat protein